MLKAVLSRYGFSSGEFGRAVSYIIYDEDNQPFSLTGYTVTLLGGSFSSTTIPDPNQTTNKGRGAFTFTEHSSPTGTGLRYVRFRLEKAGVRIYTNRIKVTINE